MSTPARPTLIRHYVLAALLVVTAINYVQRNCINPAVTTIEGELGISRLEMGDILSAFFLSYTFMQVPSGMVAQFLGAKWALVLFTVGWSLALGATAWAESYFGLYTGRLAIGALQAGIFPCATVILQAWYPASRRGIATALLNSFMVLGGAIGTVATGWMLGPLGWRNIFLVFMVPGLLWAAWFAWWFRRRPEEHPGVNEAELAIIRGFSLPPATLDAPSNTDTAPTSDHLQRGEDRTGIAAGPATSAAPAETSSPLVSQAGALTVLAILTLVLIYTQQGFRAGANRLFDIWMPTYYQEARGLTREAAAELTSMLQIALFVGGLVGGALSDYVLTRTHSRWAARNGVALASLLGACVFYLAAYPIDNVYFATLIFGLGAFIFTFSSPCAYALCIDVGGKYLAIIFGLMNMVGNLGAWAFVKYLPRLQEAGGWNLALGVFVAMHLGAAFCWLFLNPSLVIGGSAPRKE
ncbi:MAG: MFS transporter [Gemmataceae bacterium]